MSNKKKRPSYIVKADFNNGKFTVIPDEDVAAFSQRLDKIMSEYDIIFRQSQRVAHERAANTFLNA